MKKSALIFYGLATVFVAALEAANPTAEYASQASRLAGLEGDQVLETIRSDQWLELPALSVVDAKSAGDLKAISTQALLALRQEAHFIAELSDSNDLLSRTQRAADIAKSAQAKGGYLNELIAVSAERVFLLGAWNLLAQSPELAQKLVPTIEARRRLPNPKVWFSQRSQLDPEVAAKKVEIEAMKSNVSGFQATMELRPEGNAPSALPSVIAQVTDPSIVDLWWEIYLTDFRISAVLRSATDFVIRGGVLVPEPENKPAAIEKVFGPDGSPYHHELRRGSIRSDDIWTEWKAAREQSLRNLQIAQWFGE